MNRKQAAMFIAWELLSKMRDEVIQLMDADTDQIVGTIPTLQDLLQRIENAAKEAQK